MFEFEGVKEGFRGATDIDSCGKSNKLNAMYGSSQVRQNFADFYANKGGVQDAFVNFWVEVAKRFKRNDNVMGYDIMNEPWPSTVDGGVDMKDRIAQFD